MFGVARILLALILITALIGDFDYVLGFATFVTSNFFNYTCPSIPAAQGRGVTSTLRTPQHQNRIPDKSE
ncbi:hypothetical protein SAMN05216282_12514 [Cryobacterium psychrotolerans]|uniref:Uncharacterized protein n=1 Tax=Cryobacterium psychrotolerans TaxID=386301 RepID=A0A1G9GZJ5_9MICO|nr:MULTISPECIES: hypothetical protein [Cryobacterium]TFD48502.1 hypothetical protein E3T33_01430 [Cryobacterium sp. TMT1-2-1]TFD86708.1 hypothetical protein E3T56_06770 [Cryobacterium psychrotolerans]SDL06118.1 hypothetical protein SAMN05216282_12514 [Cryobacterium psychrotolerans]